MTKGCLNIIDKSAVATGIAKKGRWMVATFMWKQLLVAGSLSAVLFTVSFLISTWNDKIIQIAGFLSGVAAMTNGIVP